MIKNLFKQLLDIIFHSEKTWERLSGEPERNNNTEFYRSYLYPVIGIISLLVFLGVFINKKNFEVELALRTTIAVSVSLFVGFYIASFAISKLLSKFFSMEVDMKKCERFVGYSSGLLYLVYMFLALFPDFFFIKLGLLYTVYIIWESTPYYILIPEENRLKYSIVSTLVILFAPVLVEKIIFFTMPGLRS